MTQSPTETLSKPSRPKLRRWAGNLLVLGVTTAICVLLLEVTVRRLFPYYSPGAQVLFRRAGPDLVLGPPMETVRLATPKGDYDTQMRFNEDGLRDTKSLRETTVEDWIAVGDSFTLGMGVDEDKRYSNVLEDLFKANGSGMRVFNVAIPDNFIGYQRLLKYAEGRTTNVHQLIVGVCMENDIRDYRDGKSGWDFGYNPLERNQKPSLKERLREWFKSHSALYIALTFELQKTTVGRRLFERAGIARNVDQLSKKNSYDEALLMTCRDEILKIVAGREAIILIIPARLLWAGNNMEVERRVHDRFVELITQANVRLVDMRPVFEHEGNPLQFYFANDPHWNNRGHEAAAAELFARIREGAAGTFTTNKQ